jgi:Mannosyltransferase putative
MVAGATYHIPNGGEDLRDLDLSYMARSTSLLKRLLQMYGQLPASAGPFNERAAFRQAIDDLQVMLYPWITKSKDGKRSYTSIFDLEKSYRDDVGIVISTGKNGFRWAVHQIVTLRAIVNSTLPIEIFYGGDDDLPENYRNYLHSLEKDFPHMGSITTVDIKKKFPDPDGILGLPGGWAMRPYSILASSFRKSILSDADTIFIQDPRRLVDEPAFKKYGSLFWHDRLLAPAAAANYKWSETLMEDVDVKNMQEIKKESSGWFDHRTFYEMERLFSQLLNI